MVHIIYFITFPLLILIHLWAIRLLIKNPYSIQFETVLFIGFWGAVGGICYFILAQKIAYFNLGIESAVYYVIVSVGYIIAAIILIGYQVKKYANIKKQGNNGKRRSYSRYGVVVALAPALGYLIAQNSKRKSEYLMYCIILAVSLLFCILLTYFSAKYFHKFFFMKANKHLAAFS